MRSWSKLGAVPSSSAGTVFRFNRYDERCQVRDELPRIGDLRAATPGPSGSVLLLVAIVLENSNTSCRFLTFRPGQAKSMPRRFILQPLLETNTASYSEAARDVGSATGDEVGRWSGASSFVYITGILGRSFAGTGCSVGFLKQGSALTADLTYSVVEVKGGAGYAVG